MSRRAACQCGQLTAICKGEPVRISVCHCLECQRRSGAPFAVQARFPAENVLISGESREWLRAGDSGAVGEHHFCPECGSTLWSRARADHSLIAIPVGNFADPTFPAPRISVYEERMHGWIDIPGEDVEHYD